MLGTLPLLHDVSADQLDELIASTEMCMYDDGERVFCQGECANYWYLVMAGRIDTLREGVDGECRVVQSIESGQLLAPIVMFMPVPLYPVSSRAVGSVTLCRFKRTLLHALCRANSEVALRMLEIAGSALSKRINDVENLSSRNGPQRLAAYLHEQYLRQGCQITLPLSHRELAAKLGIRPETLSRLLRNLRDQKVVQGQKRNWTVINGDLLARAQLPVAN